ncbi:MAG: hypothetical protein P1U53_11130 [Sulfitobacter sp.]|nr:hypothetical protein [Sulfitobacter sp.]
MDVKDPEIRAAVAATFPDRNPDTLFPLLRQEAELRVSGSRPEFVNLLRAVVLDDLPGMFMTFKDASFQHLEGSDPFAKMDFVRKRLQTIPISAEFRDGDATLEMRFENSTQYAKTFYAGDLRFLKGKPPAPPFNPTMEIATLQPGKVLRVDEIRLESVTPRFNIAGATTARAAHRPLDREEVPASEMAHTQGGSQMSGFRESGMVAKPRKFLLRFDVIAAPPRSQRARAMVISACNIILGKLRAIEGVMAGSSAGGDRNKWLALNGSAELFVADEITQLMTCLQCEMDEMFPDLKFVGAPWVPHEKGSWLKFNANVPDEDLGTLLGRAIASLQKKVAAFQRGVEAVRLDQS